ncbi:hypothetical protein HAX54_037784 [Datura stramonium]|uniref:pectinesterase n=1 Tax=Datura stramonium TaxID=4076 RepID=A0ABS8SHP6_DATST|nr:hypothetical protein [Datura stramonium]
MAFHAECTAIMVVLLATSYLVIFSEAESSSSSRSQLSTAILIKVDQSGKGDYKKIQELIRTHMEVGKAVALRVEGDRVAFVGCRIKSHQDTLPVMLVDITTKTAISRGLPISYVEMQLLSLRNVISSLYAGDGDLAQHRQSPQENTGFIFVGCKISGVKSAILGRPWGAYARVVFVQTYMSSVILPNGWEDWNDPSRQRTSYFAEYKCYGPGASSDKRVNWLRTLSSEEAVPYLKESIMGPKSWIRSKPTHFDPIVTKLPASLPVSKSRSSP